MNITFISGDQNDEDALKRREAVEAGLRSENVRVFSVQNVHKKKDLVRLRQDISRSDGVVIDAKLENVVLGQQLTFALLYNKPVLLLTLSKNTTDHISHPLLSVQQYHSRNVDSILHSFVGELHHTHSPDQLADRYGSASSIIKKTNNKLLVIGSVSIDVFLQTSRIPKLDEVVYTDRTDYHIGGKATNVAIGLARLGENVTFFGKTGNDPFANMAEANLVAEDIDITGVERDSKSRTGTVHLTVAESGEFSTVVHEAANQRLSEGFFDRILAESEVDAAYITLEPQKSFLRHAIPALSKKNLLIVCDPSPYTRPLEKSLYPYIDFLMPNRAEAEAMLTTSIQSIPDAQQAALRIRENGGRSIIITLGEDGSVLLEKDSSEPRHFPAYDVASTNDVGAGDAFRSAFVSEFLKTRNVDDAIRYATAAGGILVTKPGAAMSMPTRHEIDFFRENTQLKEQHSSG